MNIYYGIVVDNNDPAKMGKVQIKIHGEHDKTSDKETLPWAEVMQSSSNGLTGGIGFSSVLKIGTWVYVIKLENNENRYLVIGTCTGIVGEDQTGITDNTSNTGLSDFGHCSITDSSLNNRALNDTTTTSNGVSFQYENTVSQGKYTDSSVYRSSSGIMVEVDDHDERLKVTHPSGSIIEFTNNGIVLTSLNNLNINVKGDMTFNVKGNFNLNVDGDVKSDIKSNVETGIQGNIKTSVKGIEQKQTNGDYSSIYNSDVYTNIDGELQVKASDGLLEHVNTITKQGVNLDKHVHSGVDRGRSNTDKAEDSV